MRRVSVVGNAGAGKTRLGHQVAVALSVPHAELDAIHHLASWEPIEPEVPRREELWNGNRERVRNVLSWDPHKSIIRWSWTQHEKYQERFTAAMASPSRGHITFVRLTNHRAANYWLSHLREDPDGR